jgi:pilus assembly protein Flp/PilA
VIELAAVIALNVTSGTTTRGQGPHQISPLTPRHLINHNSNIRKGQMKNLLLNMHAKFQSLKNGEEGQDLVEYALLVALIALVCVTGINNVATALATVFTNISNSLA